MTILISLIVGAFFAMVSRESGAGRKTWADYIIAAPFCLLAGAISPIGYIIGFAFAFWGRRMGHGQYFDLGEYSGEVESPEKIDFIVKSVFGEDDVPNIRRDLFGLAITGLVLPMGLILMLLFNGQILWALGFVCMGVCKSAAYYLPLRFPNIRDFMTGVTNITFDEESGHTEPAEWINGFIIGTFVAIFIMIQ